MWTKLIEERIIHFDTIYENAARSGAMPAQQQSNQARFSRAGCADDRHVGSGGNLQADVAQNLMPCGDDANVFKLDGGGRASLEWGGNAGGPLFQCAQRLKQSKCDVTIRGILP